MGRTKFCYMEIGEARYPALLIVHAFGEDCAYGWRIEKPSDWRHVATSDCMEYEREYCLDGKVPKSREEVLRWLNSLNGNLEAYEVADREAAQDVFWDVDSVEVVRELVLLAVPLWGQFWRNPDPES